MLQLITLICAITACLLSCITILKIKRINENQNKNFFLKSDLGLGYENETEYFKTDSGNKLVINTLIKDKKPIDAEIEITLENKNGQKLDSFIFETNKPTKNQKVFYVQKGEEYRFNIHVMNEIKFKNHELVIGACNY